MDSFGFIALAVVFVAIGFVMGRNYQRSGRIIPDPIHRFVESNRPAPAQFRGMGGLMLAVVALLLSFFFILIAQQSRDSGAANFATLCFLAYWAVVPVWVYKDAKSRGERALAWGLMTFFTNILGLFSYLITRPDKPRACQRCGYVLREEFSICPFCGPQAGLACGNCQSAVEPGWGYCPYCQSALPADNGPSAFTPPPSNSGPGPTPAGVVDAPIASS